jgi:uncharacterized coiled-coil DUF342 family protein
MRNAERAAETLKRLNAMDAALEERAANPHAPRMSDPVVMARPTEVAVVRPVLADTAVASPWFAWAGFFAVGMVWGLAILWMTRRRYHARSLAHVQHQAALAMELTAVKTHTALLKQTLEKASSDAQESRAQLEQLQAVSLAQASATPAAQEVSAAVSQELEELRQANVRVRAQQADTEWYLGEERAKGLQAAEIAQHLQGEMERLRTELAEARQQREEAHWYLGETRAAYDALQRQVETTTQELASATAAHQAALDQLQQARQARDEANWYLGEEQHARAQQHLELEQLRAQVAPPAQAVWNGQERRHGPRQAYDDASAMPAELCDPVTGKRFGRGRAVNLGRLGLGLKLAFLPLLGRFKDGRVRCRLLPAHGDAHPIESEGRIAWQRRGRGSSGEAGIAFDPPMSR